MFGFFVGTACLVGLFAVLRHRRRNHYGHYGFGRGRCGHHGLSPLNHVLDRLDATPGQEKEIRVAILDLMEEARAARRDFRGSREDVARVIRQGEIPEGAFDSVFQKHDEVLGRLREAAQRAFRKVHETLDARQRETLSGLVEGFEPWFFRRGY